MSHFKSWGKALFFWLFASFCWAEVSPISMTLFGLYGEPFYPLALANPAPNAFGLNFLLDWQASSYASFGLGFEQTTFYQAPNFTTPMVNLETRVFPLENEKGKFSPYIYGGVGLNLATGNWQGPLQLKTGIGSRIRFVGPLFFDFAVGSHWVQPPNSFQYVDFRSGLSLSFGFKEPSTSPATSKPTPIPSIMPTPTISPTPLMTPNPNWTPIPTPLIEIPQSPVTTLAQVKKYYKLGMKAFMARNYALSLKLLKKSIGSKEIHKAAYYYAETYATIGVIYQFHAHKVKDHDQKALMYYQKALAIDPHTKSAKAYYKKLKAKLAKQAVKKKKTKAAPTPTPSDTTSSNVSSNSDLSGLPESSTGNTQAPAGSSGGRSY